MFGRSSGRLLDTSPHSKTHVDSPLCCRHNMKLRTMLEHEAGPPPLLFGPPLRGVRGGCQITRPLTNIHVDDPGLCCRHNMKLRTMLEHEVGAPPPVWAAAAGCTGALSEARPLPKIHIDILLCCRHNMKLRTMLEHEAGAPPPVWAASAGSAGGLSEADSALTGAPLWELALLHRHYHPTLAKAAIAVAAIPPQGTKCCCRCSLFRFVRLCAVSRCVAVHSTLVDGIPPQARRILVLRRLAVSTV